MSDTVADIDIDRAGILQEILRFLTTPHTIEEVADEFGWHPQTAREKVWELRDMAKVKELTRKKARKKVWQATSLSSHLTTEGYAVVTSSGTAPLRSFAVNSLGNRRALGDIIGAGLAYIWRRAYYQQQDQENVLNVARQGSLDPLLDVRKGLEIVYLRHKQYMETLEKMLTEMPELWQEGNPAVLDMFGRVNREEMEVAVGDFEQYIRGILGK